jgi:hypothetical protein
MLTSLRDLGLQSAPFTLDVERESSKSTRRRVFEQKFFIVGILRHGGGTFEGGLGFQHATELKK